MLQISPLELDLQTILCSMHCVEDLALNVIKRGVNIENLILNRLAAKNEGIFSEV